MFKGKGFYIWQIRNCEQGDAVAIANLASVGGYSHILIKVADGEYSYNLDMKTGLDLVPQVAQELKNNGIKVWGWQYLYGNRPIQEADIAIQRIQQLELDGFALDVEAPFKQGDKKPAAEVFMNRLRGALPDFPIALSSYRYPTYHQKIPWNTFLEKCDYNMPQLYWMKSHNAGEQLVRCVNEFAEIEPVRPIIPTGSAFIEQGWEPQVEEILDLFQTAQELNLEGVNFWEWSNTRKNLPEIWSIIQQYYWPIEPGDQDITKKYIQHLNTHDPNTMLDLYNQQSLHVTTERTIKGLEQIREWYTSLFTHILPNATFTLESISGSDNTRRLNWTASSNKGSVHKGTDFFGIVNGQINYHFTHFVVSQS